ncbi:MAG TPA: hypothetical protein VM934_10715 [Pyrinomonadaceae bacterium]|nr:hypothetical protein [Pyrinomonadaceae bacterium]
MSSTRDSQRIDLLLALALVFDEGERRAGDEGLAETPAGAERDMTSRAARASESLASLGAAERLAVERRAQWFVRLTPGKQREWLAHVLGLARAREAPAQLDEHVHPSHVVRALRQEPPHIQNLIIGHLPPALASEASEALGAPLAARENGANGNNDARDNGSVLRRRASDRASRAAQESRGADAGDAAGVAASQKLRPSPEVVSVVRRSFLSNFTSAREINRPGPLDLLSGAELARLVRLLGVRETALACRGIAAVEAVASFLRRFAAEDARAIAAHIATLTDVDSSRIAFAEEVVREAMNAEPEPGAMLDRTGLRLLAITLAGRDEARLRYTAQKLPLEAARWLQLLASEAARILSNEARGDDAHTREMMRLAARDTEALAAGVKRRTQLVGGQQRAASAPDGGARPGDAGANP